MSSQPQIHKLPGAIHPPDNKLQSTQRGIEQLPLPQQLTVPLLQHIGSVAEPVVQVGEQVLKGQLLAKASSQLSCPVHAPTSGIITAIGPAPYPHPSGLPELAISIDSDGEDRWTSLQPHSDYQTLEPLAVLHIIQAAGVSGLGGAGFPTAAKLSIGPEQQIHTLIINGTECEPYITADDMSMRLYAHQIVAGIEVLMHILKPTRVLIGIEDNKPEAIAAMRTAVGERQMQVVVFPTAYPSGGEKQLIYILTGQEVPSGGLPADIGMLCQNVGSMLAVHDAVLLGQPLISRVTTLTGDALQRPTNVRALIGTPINDLLSFAGLQKEQLYRLLMGGPMMGFSLPDSGAPLIKTSNCLLAATQAELPPPPPASPCIRCGLCAEACPAGLLPQQLHWFALGKDYEQLERQNLFDCIECGACSYVCPSSIPLVQYYRASKAEIRTIEQQQNRAEHSKARFEQRQERLEREARQRELERQARAERTAQAKAAREAAAAAAGVVAEEPTAPDLARLQSRQPATLRNEHKQLKIAAATAQMALRRAQKQLLANPDNASLQLQVVELEQAWQQAQQAFTDAQGGEDNS